MIKRKVKPRPKLKIKRRPKLTEWQLFYNRLQDDDLDVYSVVSKHIGGDVDGELFDMLEGMLAKFDAQINTLQINYPDKVSWRIALTWADRSKEPLYGVHYPTLYSVKCSTHLIHAATLAYLDLCTQAKQWL